MGKIILQNTEIQRFKESQYELSKLLDEKDRQLAIINQQLIIQNQQLVKKYKKSKTQKKIIANLQVNTKIKFKLTNISDEEESCK